MFKKICTTNLVLNKISITNLASPPTSLWGSIKDARRSLKVAIKPVPEPRNLSKRESSSLALPPRLRLHT